MLYTSPAPTAPIFVSKKVFEESHPRPFFQQRKRPKALLFYNVLGHAYFQKDFLGRDVVEQHTTRRCCLTSDVYFYFFEHDFLRARPSQKMDLLDEHPEFFAFTRDKSFKIAPASSGDYDRFKEWAKNPVPGQNPEEIKILAWAIHPSLRNAEILDEERRGEVLKGLQDNGGTTRYYPGQSRDRADSNSFTRGRTASQTERTIADMEEESGATYLASILDLKRSDVGSLEELKELSLKHLREQYGVTNEKKAKMFFHFPYSEATMTLHMHIRVDEQHNLEKTSSFSIDEVIQSLKEHDSVIPLILSRKYTNSNGDEVSGVYKSLIYDPHLNIPGYEVSTVPNPFYDPSLDVTNNADVPKVSKVIPSLSAVSPRVGNMMMGTLSRKDDGDKYSI